MSQIVLNEKGESIWANPEERLEEIEQILKPHLEDMKIRSERNEMKQYPAKLNFIPQITNLLDAYLRRRPLVRDDYAKMISAELLQDFASAFFELLIFIRQYVPEYIANKQAFCAFASISVNAFNFLNNAEDGEVVAITENLLDSFHDTNMSGAMGGTVNTSATFNRMKAKDAGYNLEIKNEGDGQKALNINVFDKETVAKKLANMFGNKFIEDKK